MIIRTLKQLKRLLIAVIGFSVLLVGIAMIFLPGPAIVVIPLGLGILATEFVWARHVLNRVKLYIEKKRGANGANARKDESTKDGPASRP